MVRSAFPRVRSEWSRCVPVVTSSRWMGSRREEIGCLDRQLGRLLSRTVGRGGSVNTQPATLRTNRRDTLGRPKRKLDEHRLDLSHTVFSTSNVRHQGVHSKAVASFTRPLASAD